MTNQYRFRSLSHYGQMYAENGEEAQFPDDTMFVLATDLRCPCGTLFVRVENGYVPACDCATKKAASVEPTGDVPGFKTGSRRLHNSHPEMQLRVFRGNGPVCFGCGKTLPEHLTNYHFCPGLPENRQAEPIATRVEIEILEDAAGCYGRQYRAGEVVDYDPWPYPWQGMEEAERVAKGLFVLCHGQGEFDVLKGRAVNRTAEL